MSNLQENSQFDFETIAEIILCANQFDKKEEEGKKNGDKRLKVCAD